MEVCFCYKLSSQIWIARFGILVSMYPYTMVYTLWFCPGKAALHSFYLHIMGGDKILTLIAEENDHQPASVTGRVENKEDSITHPFRTPLQNMKTTCSFDFIRLPRNFVKLIQVVQGVLLICGSGWGTCKHWSRTASFAHQPMGEMETCIFHDLPFCLDKYLREFELQICNLMNLDRILPS